MTTITKLELYHVTVPLAQPFYPSWIPGYPQTESRFTLLRLLTDDGVEGLAAGNAFEEEREGLGSLLGPYLIGLDPTNIDRVRQLLRESSVLGWHNPWIEAACWDIKGKIEGQPVYRLLNPDLPEPVRSAKVYASSGSILPVDERLRYLDTIRAMGFEGVKLRVHDFELRRDVAIVEASRRHLGDDFVIGVDANQGWRVTLVDTGDGTMTGGRIKRVREYIGQETFCMTYGDGVADVDVGEVVRFHREQGTLATLTAVQPGGRFGVFALEGDQKQVTQFAEKPKGDGAWINGGFFVLEPGVIDRVESDDIVWERGPMERLAREGQLSAYRHYGFWQPMDPLRDRRVLEEHWESGNAPWKKFW